MSFPVSCRELKRLFKGATPPDITEFKGEYLVDMLTVWPSFKRFSHKKVIYRKNDGVLGYNVLFNRVWGHFAVREGVCSDVDSVRVAVIDYNRVENSFPFRGIRDYVRCVEKNELFIGRFYYSFAKRKQFLGYFSLEKIA